MTDRNLILLVESDSGAAMSIGRELKKSACDVLLAADAVHALSLARLERPDVVVLNGQLAGGGLAALRRIRSNVNTAHIPVIGMIGRGGAQRREMLDAGAQACVEQPVDIGKLHAAIQDHLLQTLDFTQAPAEVLAAPERLADLQETGLLDSPPDESFDLLTRLTSRLLGTPIAALTLVDQGRAFYKSQTGFAAPWAEARETGLSHSLCQWVVSGAEELVVRDLREHPVLRKNLAVSDMGANSYAGVPIFGRGNQPVGSFCAIDSRPHEWTADDIATLHDLARITEAYALLGRAAQPRAAGVAGAGGAPAGSPRAAAQIGAGAIIGTARILRRYGARITFLEKDQLLDIIERQAGQMAAA